MILMLLVRAINLFSDIIVMLICASAVMSWFTRSFGPGLWKIYHFIQSVTEPLIRPFRNLLWKFSSQMGIDFSPILAILAVQFVARLLTRVLITI